MRFIIPYLIWGVLVSYVAAKKELVATSLVTCMENSQLSAHKFDVKFNPDDGSLRYTLNMNSEINGYVLADVYVYAYGFKIIHQTVNLCKIGWKQFCPLYPGVIDIDSIEYISHKYVSEFPGITYTVPDIDAVARVIVRDYTNGTELACIQASFSNGRTVSHVAAKWVTAVIAGIGLLASALLSSFGNSNSASHISANAVSLFLYFQSVVIVSMQHVQEVPPIAAAWSENLSWSMGLIRVTFMQEIFRWYVQATGGTPSLNLKSDTVAILVQRGFQHFKRAIGMQYIEDLVKRDTGIYSLEGNSNLLIFRGIKRVAFKANIEITSVCCTGFTFFVLFAYVLIGIFIIFKTSLALFVKLKWIKPDTALDFKRNWKVILKGVMQRYIYIGYTQLIILSFWQYIQRDSAAVIVLAVIFMIFSLGIMFWSSYRTLKFGRLSVQLHNNPAAILYGDSRVLNKYGWFYTMFQAKKYWWGTVMLIHTTIKAIFIAFAQSSGKTQAFAIFIFDLAYCCWLIYEKPYLDRPTNIINILINVVITVNSFLFTFFSNLYGQAAPVASIMGWVFFILNAAFSLILLILILVYAAIAILSKNPDARFHPAKDDRASFQHNKIQNDLEDEKNINANSDELFALGLTAKDHHENWAGEMYKLRDYVASDTTSVSRTPDVADESFGSKLVHKLTRGKSLNKTKSLLRKAKLGNNANNTTANDTNIVSTVDADDDDEDAEAINVKRVSDTLLSPPPTSNTGQFHQRTESITPMINQQQHDLLNDDAASVSTNGISNYDDNINGSTGDFNFKNLNVGAGNNQPYKFHESPRKSLSHSVSNVDDHSFQSAKRGSFDYDN